MYITPNGRMMILESIYSRSNARLAKKPRKICQKSKGENNNASFKGIKYLHNVVDTAAFGLFIRNLQNDNIFIDVVIVIRVYVSY